MAAEHFPAPVITSADMTDVRDMLALVAPGMKIEVVFFDEGLACGCTEIFTIASISDIGMEISAVDGGRFGVNATDRNRALMFGRKGRIAPPVMIRAIRTLAHV